MKASYEAGDVDVKRQVLEIVKRRVVKDYFIIGILEQFEDTLALFEIMLPMFYKGATDAWKSDCKYLHYHYVILIWTKAFVDPDIERLKLRSSIFNAVHFHLFEPFISYLMGYSIKKYSEQFAKFYRPKMERILSHNIDGWFSIVHFQRRLLNSVWTVHFRDYWFRLLVWVTVNDNLYL